VKRAVERFIEDAMQRETGERAESGACILSSDASGHMRTLP